jgi:hypothetical protein
MRLMLMRLMLPAIGTLAWAYARRHGAGHRKRCAVSRIAPTSGSDRPVIRRHAGLALAGAPVCPSCGPRRRVGAWRHYPQRWFVCASQPSQRMMRRSPQLQTNRRLEPGSTNLAAGYRSPAADGGAIEARARAPRAPPCGRARRCVTKCERATPLRGQGGQHLLPTPGQ